MPCQNLNPSCTNIVAPITFPCKPEEASYFVSFGGFEWVWRLLRRVAVVVAAALKCGYVSGQRVRRTFGVACLVVAAECWPLHKEPNHLLLLAACICTWMLVRTAWPGQGGVGANKQRLSPTASCPPASTMPISMPPISALTKLPSGSEANARHMCARW
eukprot:351188-Chlamydomonas_euryale.AAC.6